MEAQVAEPRSTADCSAEMRGSLIARGLGRSYGDSASAERILQTTHLDHFIAFDPVNGIVSAEAGVTLNQLIDVIVPKGWFLPVTPGTSFVTVGGAIASDIHGKNHHVAGTFCQHVESITMMLGSGETVETSPTVLPDLFRATCGGMGLTGVILSASFRLIPIRSSSIRQTTFKAASLDEACAAFEDHRDATYSVAWIDCLASGKSLGKSVVMIGEHSETGGLTVARGPALPMPKLFPSALLNSFSIAAFNRLYFGAASHGKTADIPFFDYFYPLDKITDWNRMYGRSGLLQYQFVVPSTEGTNGLRRILERIAGSGRASFLAVLKQFGERNDNLLSFPMGGYTLALDFKRTSDTIGLLHELDEMVIDLGGRTYLTKDAVMKESAFKRMYPDWQRFESVRERYGAIGRFASAQSQRIGLS